MKCVGVWKMKYFADVRADQWAYAIFHLKNQFMTLEIKRWEVIVFKLKHRLCVFFICMSCLCNQTEESRSICGLSLHLPRPASCEEEAGPYLGQPTDYDSRTADFVYSNMTIWFKLNYNGVFTKNATTSSWVIQRMTISCRPLWRHVKIQGNSGSSKRSAEYRGSDASEADSITENVWWTSSEEALNSLQIIFTRFAEKDNPVCVNGIYEFP